MTCFERLKACLARLNLEQLALDLGYHHPDRLRLAVDQLREQPDLYAWLKTGYFDFHYGAGEMFLKLCAACGLPTSDCEAELADAKDRLACVTQARMPGLEVLTDDAATEQAARISGPARMALANWHCVTLDKEQVIDLDHQALIMFVQKVIANHRRRPQPYAGPVKVLSYVYHHTDGITLRFDKEGYPID